MRKAAQADLVVQYKSQVQKLTKEFFEVRKQLLAAEEKLRHSTSLMPKVEQKLVKDRH